MHKIWLTASALLFTGCVVIEDPAGDDGPASGDEPSLDTGAEVDDGAEDDDGADPDPNGFIPGSTDVGVDPMACDFLPGDCEAGFKCNLVRDEQDNDWVGRCVEIAEQTVARGERCEPGELQGTDNCEAGTVCWDIMNGEGTCLSFCDLDGDPVEECGGDDYTCNWGKSFAIGVCTPTCTPLNEDECPETCGCYWEGNAFLCLPRTSNIALGEPCGFVNDCAPGLLCAAADVLPVCEGSSCCAAFCNLEQGSSCSEGTACTAFFEEGTSPPGYENVGLCVDPNF